jgi:uncharacterized protein with PIN domain
MAANSFGTQAILYCKSCDENLVFLNTHLVVNPSFRCPYCDTQLKITIVNTVTNTIREKYLGNEHNE